MTKNDIKISGNSIGGRQGWAYICNSAKFAVLKADFSIPTEYENSDYRNFGNNVARIAWNYRGHESYKTCSLDYEDGKFSFGSAGCCLSARFGFSDALELVADANLPIIRPNDIVAIAKIIEHDGDKSLLLSLFKLSERVDVNCMTVASLIPLTDEEMKKVADDADRWCRF